MASRGTDSVAGEAPAETAGPAVGGTPGDRLRALPEEAERRGSQFVSAQAMQARLFSVYDAAAAAEEALELVQRHLTLTLGRHYYDADEIEQMAAELDSLLVPSDTDLVSGLGGAEPVSREG